MSRSPERISSYRRHFEGSGVSLLQMRVSSPSPTRVSATNRSASYSTAANTMRAGAVGRRTVSTSRKVTMPAVTSGALCVGFGMQAPLDLDAASTENQQFRSTRSSERQEMVVLNDRLAAYIEKVRSLEQQNRLLETEIEAMQNQFVKPSGLRMLYEEQLKELTRIADQLRVQRDLAVAAKDAMAAQLEAIKAKYEEAIAQRKQAELDLEAFRPDVDKATSARIMLEKQLEQLQADLEFLQRVQKLEIEELMKQIYAANALAQSSFAVPDLSSALKQIQNQYDEIAAKNLEEMDAWYGSKFEDLTNKTSKSIDIVRSVREEINGAKKAIQDKERDLEDLKTKNDALEAQLQEALARHKKEIADLQARIEAIKLELKSIKEKSAKLLAEYQELLNVKMSLEIEITTYRKLIEGEDLRLAGMVKSLSLASSSSMSLGVSIGMSGGSIMGMLKSTDTGLGGGIDGDFEGASKGESNGNTGGAEEAEASSSGNGQGDDDALAIDAGGNKEGNGEGNGEDNENGQVDDDALAIDVGGKGEGNGEDNEHGQVDDDALAIDAGGNGEGNGEGNGTNGSADSTNGTPAGNDHGNQTPAEGFIEGQAVEVTERKTVLIRCSTCSHVLESDIVEQTVDVLENEIVEQSITSNGAAHNEE